MSRGSDIGARIDGLEQAATHARGRVPDEVVDDVARVAERAASRLRLSAEHTVVAIAGATGSGKSSTFNKLTGLDLSAIGVRRPTTSWATACVWGSDGASELLEWLGIPARHQVTRDSMLDTRREDSSMEGVVLLDLPDHDSTEVAHHLEVDRLVQLADLLIWVLDPQKYADAAIHDRYLAPLATHQDVMLVVLNQIDRVPESGREQMLSDVRRILDAEGLDRVPVLAVSAREGTGLDQLRAEVASRVADKASTVARIEADLRASADRLEEASGTAKPRTLARKQVAALEDALAEAAGVPTVVDAVEQATRLRANRATGWPLVSWVSRFKPDPLRRLHLDLGAEGRQLTGRARTSMPAPTQVQRARVDTEVRALADEVSAGLSRPWVEAIRGASVRRLPDLGDRLDAALGETDLGATRIPVWAGLVRILQWLLILTALLGAVWLGVLALSAYIQVSPPDAPSLLGLPAPTVMLLGGVALGLLLAFVCRFLVAATARRRARSADARLREAINAVAAELVVGPIETELAAYTAVREGLFAARR